MRLTYDPRYNVVYMRFQERKLEAESIRLSDEVVVDIAADGTVYGIELLNANEQLGREDISRLIVINEAAGESTEVPLAIGEIK